jgi:hypothetical protein
MLSRADGLRYEGTAVASGAQTERWGETRSGIDLQGNENPPAAHYGSNTNGR